MKNPLVSVIITTREEEKYLTRTLQAVRNQTYRPIEIVVSDAESRDKTVQIARKHGAKVFVKKTNIPQGRNYGAEKSRGKILVFLDADTILEKNWIKKAVDDLKKKEVDMAVGVFRPRENSVSAKMTCWIWSDFLPYILKIFGKEMHGGGSTFVIKRNIFMLSGGFKEDQAMLEDAEFVNRISRKRKVLWDRQLVSRTSMRRFRKGGYWKWCFYWFINGINFLIFNKPLGKHYKVIR